MSNRIVPWLLTAASCFASTAPAQEPPKPVVPVAPDQSVIEAEAQRIAAVAKASAAALAIFAKGGQGGGSGVVITPDGFALSNYHVTSGAGDAMKCGMIDGKLYDAVIVGVDPVGDVALLKVLGRDDFPCAVLADSDQVRVGDWCFAVGNPFLLATDFHPSVSYGIVSGVHRYQYPSGTLLEYADCIQTDAAINPGNSGGPLFNADGDLIGINGRGSFEKRGRVNVGVGYAISINQIKNFIGYLKSGRYVDHATLGARVGTDPEGRVLVRDIVETSDAFRRGLRYDDEIVSFGGRPIRTVNAFKNVLGIFPRDWRVPLTYQREGQRYDTLVRLKGVHRAGELLAKIQGAKRPQPQRPERPGQPGPQPKQEDDPEKPKAPQLPLPGLAKTSPMPEIVKKHFEARPGYVNYHFNREAQDRIWKALVARGDFTTLTGDWTIEGALEGGGGVKFVLQNKKAALVTGGGEAAIAIGDDLSAALDPPQSGGLLAALHLWQRFLTTGIKGYGEVSYLGEQPLPGHAGLADVLTAVHGGVECRFLFDPADGTLLAVEMFPDDDSDPCELRFLTYQQIEGRAVPERVEVRHGENLYGAFLLKDFHLAAGEAK